MQFYESTRFIFLWLIPIVLLIFTWGHAERRKRVSRIGNPVFLEHRLMPGFSPRQRKIAWGLLVGVFFLATLALARPQWGDEKRKMERRGVDLIYLLDTSLSMLAEDVKPSRLIKSKLEIKNLIRRLKGDRVGMVAFEGSSFLQCPLTLDYSAFLLFVDVLKPGFIPNPGTSLSQAIHLGIQAFPEESRKYRAILIFTDGEDHEGGIEEALDEAKKAGVRLYTLGIGTTEGEPIPLRSGTDQKITGYKKDREGAVIITRLNAPLLTRVAQETGGLYLQATAGEKEIDILLKHLESLGERQLKERLISEREDHFQLFLLLALFLLIGETLLKYQKGIPVEGKAALVVLAFLLMSGFIDTPRSLVQKGNRLSQEKKYQSAVENYHKAQVAQPNEPVIRYNLGTALYQLYEYADAEKELEQSLAQAKEPTVKAKILYNYGNTKYRLGNFDKAIDAYKKVLEIDPKDEDAKYNLEFLKKKKAQFEKKQEERQKQQQKPQPQPQQNQQQQQPKPQPQKNSQQSQSPQQQEQNQNTQDGEGKADQQKEGKGQEQEQPEQKEDQKKEGEQGPQKQQQEQQQQPQQQQEQRQEEGQQQTQPQPKESGEQKQAQPSQEGPSLQGQMGKEDALRILDVLREGEKELQDLRRPPVRQDSREVLKDW